MNTKQNLYFVIGFALTLGNTLAATLEDGKLRFFEIFQFLPSLRDLPEAVKLAPEALEESKQLSEEDRDQLLSYFRDRFNLPNEGLERKIESGFSVILHLHEFINQFKK